MTMNSDPLPLADHEQIDQICLSFEIALMQKGQPKLEYYLSLVSPAARPLLLSELLRLEVDYLQRNRGKVDIEAYLRRFPDYGQVVREALRWAKGLGAAETQAGAANPLMAMPPKPLPAALPASSGNDEHHWNHLHAGDRLNRFEIRAVVGRGAFGTVYRAYDPRLERDVAIKVPRLRPADSGTGGERFVREARAAARFRHANICPVYEMDWLDDSLYLVMPFLEGQSLRDRLKSGPPLSDRQVVTLVSKLATALADAHRTGLVHRDLTPANIMLQAGDEPVVMDFGLAIRSGDVRLTRAGDVFGTPAYMCPEQARGEAIGVGATADIYSLGAILYELLSGRRTYEGDFAQVFHQILTAPVPSLAASRPELPLFDRCCTRAMAKEPGDRFASMDEFARELAICYESEIACRGDHVKRIVNVRSPIGLEGPWDEQPFAVQLHELVLVQVRYPLTPPMPKSVNVVCQHKRMAFVSASKGANYVRLAPPPPAAGEAKCGYVLVFLRASEPGVEQVTLQLAMTDGTIRQVSLAFQCS